MGRGVRRASTRAAARGALWTACVLLVLCGVAAQGAPGSEDSDHLDHDVAHEFEVSFEEEGSLGVELDERLRVTRFVRSKKNEMGPAERLGWIQVGDRLVSVNEQPMEGKSIREAVKVIHYASRPRVLRFHTRGHSDRIAQMQREMAAAASRLVAKGQLRFSHQSIPQGTFTFVQALFGGPPSCTPLRVVEANPLHGCGEMVNEGDLAGAIVVVERGICAFSDKALNLQLYGAAGVLVLNDDGPAFRMPSVRYDHDEVRISAVMVGEQVGEQVRHVLEHGLQPIEAQLVHDDKWCVETRDVDNAHPDSVQEQNLTVTQVEQEFEAGRLIVAGMDNPDVYYDEHEVQTFEYVKAMFGCEPAAIVAMEVDTRADFRASNYKIPEDHPVNVTTGVNASAKFEPTRTSGAMPMVEAMPATACKALENPAHELQGAVLLMKRGDCPFEEKQQVAAKAGVSVIVVTNDRPGLTAMRASTPAAVVDEVAAIMVTQSAGSTLRQAVREARSQGVPLNVRISGDNRLKGHWDTLEDLILKPQSWPRKFRKRRKLYFRLSREHHPDKPDGSVERFEALNFAYRLANHHFDPKSVNMDD